MIRKTRICRERGRGSMAYFPENALKIPIDSPNLLQNEAAKPDGAATDADGVAASGDELRNNLVGGWGARIRTWECWKNPRCSGHNPSKASPSAGDCNGRSTLRRTSPSIT